MPSSDAGCAGDRVVSSASLLSSFLAKPRSAMNTHIIKQSPMIGVIEIKTVRLASANAALNWRVSAADRSSGMSYDDCTSDWSGLGSALRKADCMIWLEEANPTAPPNARRKLRLEMTTARSALVECAWRAMRHGWKTLPTPMPRMIWAMTAAAMFVLTWRIQSKHAPLDMKLVVSLKLKKAGILIH